MGVRKKRVILQDDDARLPQKRSVTATKGGGVLFPREEME